MSSTVLREKIIVAVDVPDEAGAIALLGNLGDAIGYYKVGLQLFTRCGPSILERVRQTGAKLFLDLKFHDIPNTVEHAVESACALGVDMMTIHLSGGGQMIAAAARGASHSQALVLGVTVLTSSSRETLREVAVESEVEQQVLRLADLGLRNGVRGVVASPLEIKPLRERFGNELTIVTPGVRPSWAAANDQKRIMTPHEAIQAGASHLVIGRPITAAPNPRDAAARILEEIAS